jgi:hypothetical protein
MAGVAPGSLQATWRPAAMNSPTPSLLLVRRLSTTRLILERGDRCLIGENAEMDDRFKDRSRNRLGKIA